MGHVISNSGLDFGDNSDHDREFFKRNFATAGTDDSTNFVILAALAEARCLRLLLVLCIF